MEGRYKDLAEKIKEIAFSHKEWSEIQRAMVKKLKGVKNEENRSRLIFWHLFDYLLDDAEAETRKGNSVLIQKSHERFFEAVLILERNLDEELYPEAVEHLGALDNLDWYLTRWDSEYKGVITLALFQFYRRAAEKKEKNKK